MMKKNSIDVRIRILGLYLVVLSLFMGTKPDYVDAVDYMLIEHVDPDDPCGGSGPICGNLEVGTCCQFHAVGGTVLANYLFSCYKASACSDGDCSIPQDGPISIGGNFCFYGRGKSMYNGGIWYDECQSTTTTSSLISHNQTDKTNSYKTKFVSPNGIHYTTNHTDGSWVLDTDNVEFMLSQLSTMHKEQKVEWLKEQGGYYRAATSV